MFLSSRMFPARIVYQSVNHLLVKREFVVGVAEQNVLYQTGRSSFLPEMADLWEMQIR